MRGIKWRWSVDLTRVLRVSDKYVRFLMPSYTKRVPLPSGPLLYYRWFDYREVLYNTVSSEVLAAESIIVGTFQPEPRSVPV
jgi:hypothetical protein